MKIYLVSASTGRGHLAASEALKIAAEAKGHTVVSVDVMDMVSPIYRKWFRGGYEGLVHKNPALWGKLYRGADSAGLFYAFQTALDNAFSGPVAKDILEKKPDWIVCTHSVSQPRIGNLGIPMAVVVTDVYPHKMWLRGTPSRYYVASEWSKEILEKRQPGANVRVTGIPIGKDFIPDPNVGGKRILITSGGIGAGAVRDVAIALTSLGVGELHIVTGWNEALQKSLKTHPDLCGVTLYGYLQTQQMAQLMRTCAMIVAKPGGLTTMEAMACGVPFVVYEPFMIPGQEERNAEFLVSAGAGVQTKTLDELKQRVYELMGEPGQLAKMRQNAIACGKPNAAQDIIADLEARPKP